jgi:uncharacterized protein YutE (UPF0331/DUF86 family)
MHLVLVRKLGIPQESREAFEMLCRAGIIYRHLCDRLMARVSFRNIAVHDYRKSNLEINVNIIENHLDHFRVFVP